MKILVLGDVMGLSGRKVLKKYLSKINSRRIKGIIVVSSTSTITKKYSWNKFDKELYSKLLFWENELMKLNKNYTKKWMKNFKI